MFIDWPRHMQRNHTQMESRLLSGRQDPLDSPIEGSDGRRLREWERRNPGAGIRPRQCNNAVSLISGSYYRHSPYGNFVFLIENLNEIVFQDLNEVLGKNLIEDQEPHQNLIENQEPHQEPHEKSRSWAKPHWTKLQSGVLTTCFLTHWERYTIDIRSSYDRNVLSCCLYYFNVLPLKLEYFNRRVNFLSKLKKNGNSYACLKTCFILFGQRELASIYGNHGTIANRSAW